MVGNPAVVTADGRRVRISSKRSIAMLAMLVTAPRFERSRTWLQRMLWGSRPAKLAQSSLRREIANLRKVLRESGLDIVSSDTRSIRIDVTGIECDILDEAIIRAANGEFLEGITIPGETTFEDWCREMRANLVSGTTASQGPDSGDGPTDAHRPAFAANERDGLLVIAPATTLSIASEMTELATRVTRNLVDFSARIRWLRVVCPTDQATPEGYSERHNARYVMRTEVLERTGSSTAINFTLMEMPGEIVRWSETREIRDGAVLEGHLDMEIGRGLNCVADTFEVNERRRAFEQAPDLPDPWHIAWRARFYLNQFTKSDLDKAEDEIGRGLASSPAEPELLMLRAYLALWKHWIRRAGPKESRSLREPIMAANRADPTDARGPLFSGVLEAWHGDIDTANVHLAHSIELNPYFGEGLLHYGASFYLKGQPELAVEPIERALFLTPFSPQQFFARGELATSLWMLGRYEETLELARKVQLTHPGYILSHILEVASLSAMGLDGQARSARTKLIDRKPGLAKATVGWLPFRDRAWNEKMRAAIGL